MYQVDGQIYTVSNAPAAKSYGIETQTTWLPQNTNLELSSALGLISSKYKNKGEAHIRGKHVENTPSYTLRLGVAYLHPNGMYERLDLHSFGARYFTQSKTTFIRDGAHSVLDMRLGYKTGSFDVYGRINNLADKAHLNYYNGYTATINDPRTYSLGVRYAF